MEVRGPPERCGFVTSQRRATGTVDAVHRILDVELAGRSSDPSHLEHVLAVIDVLFHRAVLRDLAPVRRDRHRVQLGRALHGMIADLGTDPYAAVGDRAAELVAAMSSRDRAAEVVRLLAAADLPELGTTAPAEQAEREARAMNWLGASSGAQAGQADVERYLRRRLGREVRVGRVAQLSGGFSKTTILVEYDRGDGPEEIVLRQITPGRDSHTLAHEYHVLEFAWKRGVDVAEPLWLEPEHNALGEPFFASRRAAGSNVGDVFGPEAGTDARAGRELARALGRLHAVDLAGLPSTPVPPMASPDDLLVAIAEQEELAAAAAGRQREPLAALLFEWLRTNVPAALARPVLLHGDPGFHNILIENGTLTAMLDWERARVGEAAQDLAYVRPHVRRVLPWKDFLAAYCEAGGEVPDEARMRFYSVWHETWRFVGAYRGLGRLMSRPASLLDGVLGLLHAPRFLLAGVENAFEVTV
ncbi:phosphotransferase family protein [Nocardia farcinica]|nr:phosphotransferase family protein [Nocardia farcinica]MBC9816231.1 phosphotransferase family protein [Nocardia farcinica]MBF6262366.1 phosphotransferase family protein [Nocardia farcinica]MBF6280906.1 phosphotransferase family protein [Nocardia farcinica]MBF6492078.1 phosphotransferase family protein [Nocardia farcinica]